MADKLIVANWKMKMTGADARAYFKRFLELTKSSPASASQKIVFCPSFISLFEAAWLLKEVPVSLGAQDVYWEESGAYTGEISAEMVKEVASYVIIGHSERRMYRQETCDLIAKKMKLALTAGLMPILCVGESRDVQEAGTSKQFIETQLRESLAGVSLNDAQHLIIAYEPVWAIGTGKTATTQQAQDAHAFIRALLVKLFDDTVAKKVRIQYGGSVKPTNARELMSQPDVDGALVGGAALEARSFADIIKNSI